MLTEEDFARVPEWNKHQCDQWLRLSESVAKSLQGLQLSRFGPRQSTFQATISNDDFYETVIIARMPQIVFSTGQARKLKRVPLPEHKKPPSKQVIDLTDDQIRQVFEAWRSRKTALDLPFVHSVWRRDGQEYTA